MDGTILLLTPYGWHGVGSDRPTENHHGPENEERQTKPSQLQMEDNRG